MKQGSRRNMESSALHASKSLPHSKCISRKSRARQRFQHTKTPCTARMASLCFENRVSQAAPAPTCLNSFPFPLTDGWTGVFFFTALGHNGGAQAADKPSQKGCYSPEISLTHEEMLLPCLPASNAFLRPVWLTCGLLRLSL